MAAMLLAAPSSRVTLGEGVAGIDADAVQEGLRARVGETLSEWTIEIGQLGEQSYRIDLTGPDGRSLGREVTLDGVTDEDRSRELASTIALLIQTAEAPRDPTPTLAPTPTPTPERSRGMLLLEGHVGLGPPRDLDTDFGLGLAGGAWLAREHLQPRAAVRWSHSWSGELAVHQVSGRLGLAVGAPVRALWLGVLAMPAIEWTHASQVRTAAMWSGGGEVSALAQIRYRMFVIGLRAGIETSFPAPRAQGTRDVIRWGHVRALLVLELGLRI